MARPRLILNPSRIHVVLEKSTKRDSRTFSRAQGFNSHNDYLVRLISADMKRANTLALRGPRKTASA